MATYAELQNLRQNSLLKSKITIAILDVAEDIRVEIDSTPNHANRLIWSREAFDNPEDKLDEIFDAMLIANKSQTVANIQNATDAALKTNVSTVIDHFATG